VGERSDSSGIVVYKRILEGIYFEYKGKVQRGIGKVQNGNPRGVASGLASPSPKNSKWF